MEILAASIWIPAFAGMTGVESGNGGARHSRYPLIIPRFPVRAPARDYVVEQA